MGGVRVDSYVYGSAEVPGWQDGEGGQRQRNLSDRDKDRPGRMHCDLQITAIPSLSDFGCLIEGPFSPIFR